MVPDRLPTCADPSAAPPVGLNRRLVCDARDARVDDLVPRHTGLALVIARVAGWEAAGPEVVPVARQPEVLVEGLEPEQPSGWSRSPARARTGSGYGGRGSCCRLSRVAAQLRSRSCSRRLRATCGR
jgi:hypothetical protein